MTVFTRLRASALAAPLLAVAAFLPACAPETVVPSAEEIAKAAVAEGVTISNPRIVLAPVAGRPAAVYFDLSYTGTPGVKLVNIAVEGAGMTMIHDYAESDGVQKMQMAGPIELSADAPVSLAPGGLHGMVMDPGPALAPGGTAFITLNFSDGTSAGTKAPVRAAGDAR